jgi:hypothetical protein
MGKKDKMLELLRAVKLERIKRSSSFKRYEKEVRRYPQAVADMILEVEEEHFAKDVSIDFETVQGPLYLYKDVKDFTTEELEEAIRTEIFPLTLNNLGEAITHITQRHSINPYEAACSASPTPDHAVFLINLDAPTHIILGKLKEILTSLENEKKKPRYDLDDIDESFQAYDLKQQGKTNPEIAEIIYPERWANENEREAAIKKVTRGIEKAEKWIGGHF